MSQRLKLTEKRVRSLEPDPQRDRFLRDAEVIGFGVRVKPSGTRSYFVEYKTGARRNRRMFLGPVGRLRLEDARAIARENFAVVARGEDPLAARQEKRDARTVADLAEQYLDEHLRPKRKPSTIREFERIVRKEILPKLGRFKLEELEPAHVARLHSAIGTRGAKRTANYTLSVLRAMLGFAERRHLIPRGTNPAALVERLPERSRERFLTAEELGRLGDVLAEIERTGEQLPTAILALRLLILTGARRSEILSLRWEDVDRDAGFLIFPEHKTSGKDGRPKRLPLTAPVAALLATAPREQGNPYVCFGARPGEPLATLQHVWTRARKRASLEGVPLHSLRHSFATVGAAAVGLHVVGKVLGHASVATTHKYAHADMDPIRAGAERIAGEIAARLERRKPAEVVEIRPKRKPR